MVRLEVGAVSGTCDTYDSKTIKCLSCLLLMFAIAGCAEPFIVFSGKALSGELTAPPQDWSPFASIEVVQLETRPEDPYSVNIWAVAVGPDFYIATGEEGTRWTEILSTEPRVRLRIDPAEIGRVAEQYSLKYGLDAEDNWVEKALVYRLEPR